MEKKTSRALLRTLNQSARRLLPSSFQRAHSASYPDLLHLDRERDAENNQRTTPPDSETIDLCCIWGVEFFTPSHRDALLAGVQRFGWKQEGRRNLRDIEEWVDKSGKHFPGVRGAWLNLGLVSSSDSPYIGPSGTNDMTRRQVYTDALPPHHVTEVTGCLTSITSSLFCVIMCFILDDDYAKRLDVVLKTDRQTNYQITPYYRDVLNPERQKIDDVKQVRHELKATVTNWFSTNFRGLFSSGLLQGEMPTCELVSLRDAEPFSISKQLDSYFLRLIGLESSYDAWVSTEIPGLKLSLQDIANISPEYHAILTMKECHLSDESLEKSMGWSGRQARTLYVDKSVNEGLLHLWALLPMLDGYGSHLRALRDSTILKPNPRQNSIRVLDELAGNVSFSIDIDAVTSELQSLAEPELWKLLPIPTFVPIRPQGYPEGYTLAESLCTAIAERALRLQKTDRSLRDHGTQYGALVGAVENVRLQKQIKYFTIALTALTIVFLIESPGVQDFLQGLYRWLQSLWVSLMTRYFL